MKIKDIINQTGASRQTIHYYLREGILPKPKKTNLNQAEYGQEHIERLLLIRELQERFFLPLSVIKGVISNMSNLDRSDFFLRVKAEHFKPKSQFLPEQIVGEENFLKETGLTVSRLTDFEKYGIISPTIKRGRKVYSQDDISIGKVIGTMRRIGLSHENGFPRDGLKRLKKSFEKVALQFGKMFVESGSKNMAAEGLDILKKPATEVMAVFFYHLFRRLSREDLDRRLRGMTGKMQPTEKRGVR